MLFSMPNDKNAKKNQAKQVHPDSLVTDTLSHKPALAASKPQETQPVDTEKVLKASGDQNSVRGLFAHNATNDTTLFTVKTPLYTAVFSNLGGGPVRFELNKYLTWDHQPVQLIKDSVRSAYSMGFISTQNYNVETQDILFKQLNSGNSFTISKNGTQKLSYELQTANGKSIIYTYTFNGASYNIDLSVQFRGTSDDISSHQIEFAWKSPLNFTEKDHKMEARDNQAYMYSGGQLDNLDIKDPGHKQNLINGQVSWVSTKTKYFTQIIKSTQPTDGATLRGTIAGKPENAGYLHSYSSSIRINIPDSNKVDFKLYVGPLRYKDLAHFDKTTYGMVYLGYSLMRFFSSPLVRYIIIPYFETIGNALGNFGIAIIVFAILVKLVLYPLTHKSFQSMAAMRKLQPELKELQDKYKSDPKKQQEQMMKLYKKAKVNPLGGCLPMLLQMPILITLWEFIQNSILIRQKAFLWAHDLSAPDVIVHLPFNIPFMGNHISGFVLLMALSMVFQMKVSGQTSSGGGMGGAQMKVMQYGMPVFMLFIFNNLASGLNLYYLIYNVLSGGQQMLINHNMNQMELLEKVDKKKAEELKKQRLIEQKKMERKSKR